MPRPKLIIERVAEGAEGRWLAVVENTTVSYDLVGATIVEQAATARALAQAMTQGWPEVSQYMGNFFEDVGGQNTIVFTQLFKNTGGLMLDERVLITPANDAMLMSEMEEAGELLLEALG